MLNDKEIESLLEDGDHHRAMRWLLLLPTVAGLPLVDMQLRGDLLVLGAEVMRLYRVEKAYRKLLKQRRDEKRADRKKA